PVAAPEVDRLQDHAVGFAVHQPVRTTLGLVEVNNAALRRCMRIERKVYAAGQPFIRSDIAERLAVGEGTPVGKAKFDAVGHVSCPLARSCRLYKSGFRLDAQQDAADR